MYGMMAIGQFLWFEPDYGGLAEVDAPEFWLLMQIAMLAGFCTAYPVKLICEPANLRLDPGIPL